MEEITQALALIDRTPLPDPQESLRAALDAGWPTTATTASLAEHFDRHVERARACASIAHEAANDHRHVARDLPAIRLSTSETSVPPAPTLDVARLVDFARAADSARRAVRTDPLWRAATFLQDCAHQQKVELSLEQRARCRAWIAHAEAPVREIAVERSQAARLLPRLQRLEETAALREYVQTQNQGATPPGVEAPAAPLLRVASDEDRHRELAPLLTRTLAGQEFKVLRPLSGDPTLLVAYARDLQPSSSSTVRLRLPPSSLSRSSSRGVER
jgi:hypothetical protein